MIKRNDNLLIYVLPTFAGSERPPQNNRNLCKFSTLPLPFTTMWRRSSLSLSSKLLHSSPCNLSTSYGVVRTPIPNPHLYSASSESFNLGFPKPDGTVDLSSMAVGSAARVRQVPDVARHYGRCYWELSKARLRYWFLKVFHFCFSNGFPESQFWKIGKYVDFVWIFLSS